VGDDSKLASSQNVASGVTPAIGFTGHVNDADTGLVYMQQRYYDPVAGRFLSVDPVTTDASTGSSFNRYAYASNNPLKNIDPDGRDDVNAFVPPGVQFQKVVEAVFGPILNQDSKKQYGTVSKTTLNASIVEVSRTTTKGEPGGSTFVGLRTTPGYSIQTSVDAVASAGDASSGLTAKASASAGLGPVGVSASASVTLNAEGAKVSGSVGTVALANSKGIILGAKAPGTAFGVTVTDKTASELIDKLKW
jgi:RHS repeat-associated protein